MIMFHRLCLACNNCVDLSQSSVSIICILVIKLTIAKKNILSRCWVCYLIYKATQTVSNTYLILRQEQFSLIFIDSMSHSESKSPQGGVS